MTLYVCANVQCNRTVKLDNKDPIMCPHCGGRVLQKPTTKKAVQLVSR